MSVNLPTDFTKSLREAALVNTMQFEDSVGNMRPSNMLNQYRDQCERRPSITKGPCQLNENQVYGHIICRKEWRFRSPGHDRQRTDSSTTQPLSEMNGSGLLFELE
jgi:hypothetical protein